MTNYEFQKLNAEKKWEERNQEWAKDKPESYIRFLIINDDIDILKKYEKEPVNFDFSYKIKDEILLTLAMEKNAYQIINHFLDKGLIIKERDIVGLVRNFREEENKDKFIEVLDKVDFNKINFNTVLVLLEDYFYDDNLNQFLNYGLNLNLKVEDSIIEKLKKNEELAFIFDKDEKRKAFQHMNEKFAPKSSTKANKI